MQKTWCVVLCVLMDKDQKAWGSELTIGTGASEAANSGTTLQLGDSVYVLTFLPSVYPGKRKSVFFCNCFAHPTVFTVMELRTALSVSGTIYAAMAWLLCYVLANFRWNPTIAVGEIAKRSCLCEKRGGEIDKWTCLNKKPCNGFSCFASWTLNFRFHLELFTTCSVFG